MDDGTGAIQCVQWGNAGLPALELGDLVTVRGALKTFRDERQLSVFSLGPAQALGRAAAAGGSPAAGTTRGAVKCRDPNEEMLHWMECVKLGRGAYNLAVPIPPQVGGARLGFAFVFLSFGD